MELVYENIIIFQESRIELKHCLFGLSAIQLGQIIFQRSQCFVISIYHHYFSKFLYFVDKDCN